MDGDYLIGTVRETAHRHADDLLSAGLRSEGLRSVRPPGFAEPERPSPEELRRRAIHANWQAIVDFGPLGGFGTLYGGVPHVAGREYQAFARLPGTAVPHRVLLQAPDRFDHKARCLIVTASPGSRGIYGSLALAGAWGLPHGFAVAYTDKGAGTGYFDSASGTGVRLDGTRAHAGEEPLEFEPAEVPADGGVGIKHAHSGDNPESHWGEYVLQTVEFALAMLDRAYPDAAPFTCDNTLILAVGLSNGGAAVLQAAGLDRRGALDGVVAISPSVFAAAGGRSLYDYASEASLLLSCALAAPPLLPILRARYPADAPLNCKAHGEAMWEAGLLTTDRPETWPGEALEHLIASGWNMDTLLAAASINDFELWRASGIAYAGAYQRRALGDLPWGFRFASRVPGASERLQAADAALRATWWSDAAGIPPDAGIVLANAHDQVPLIRDLLRLRSLWTGSDTGATTLRAGVEETAALLPRASLPIWVVHGSDDGLIPINFTSTPYVNWLRSEGRTPLYWEVPHAQHYDALLAWPQLGARYLPMMPYAYAALEAMLAHVRQGVELPGSRVLSTRSRGNGMLSRDHLGLG